MPRIPHTLGYVTSSTGSEAATTAQINVVNIGKSSVIKTWTFPGVNQFIGLCLSPNGGTLYAVNYNLSSGATSVMFINAATGRVEKQVAVSLDTSFSSLAIAPDGTKLLLTGLSQYPTKLGLIDTATGALTLTETGWTTDLVIGAR